jgi:hypothetical protein
MLEIFIIIYRFVFGYIRSSVLIFVVLPTVAIVCMAIIGHFNSMGKLFDFIEKTPFLYNLFSAQSGHISFDEQDVARALGVLSVVFYALTLLLNLIGLKIKRSYKRGVLMLSGIYAVSIVAILFSPILSKEALGDKSASGFIIVLIILWGICMIAYALWYFLGKVASAKIEYLDKSNYPIT